MIFLSLLVIINFGCSFQQLVLDKLLDPCYYKVPKGKNNLSVAFANNLWNSSYKNLDIYFNFCDLIDEELCGKKSAACILNKLDNTIQLTGQKFIMDEHGNVLLDAIEASNCKEDPSKKNKVTFKYLCSNEMNDIPRLVETDVCEYEVQMMEPNPEKCNPTCTTRIFNHLLDLSPLSGTFFVQSGNKNFSVALCQTNKLCKEDGITACEISNGGIIPLANQGNENTLYNEERMEVTIKSSYKGNKGTKELEILATCNWDVTRPKLVYKKVPTQGKKYKFELESRYACIKIPPTCEFFSNAGDNIVYNLTGLHKESGYWEVENVPDSRIILNICGPLKLDATPNSCVKSYSQVCEIDKEISINRGSIQSKYTILHDVISTTFTSGAVCKNNPSRQYNTIINFTCSKHEEGPKYDKTEKCDTFLTWKTPAACPIPKYHNCDFTRKVYLDCSVSFKGHIYDLNHLTKHDNMYSIKDADNTTIEYLLNVCGPVIDKDARCMKDAMVAVKYLDEVNIKYKVKSLGAMYNISVVDNNIVLETTDGDYCSKHDYKSTIHFICSDKDEPPRLTHKTECYFEFLFKTKAACPNPSELPTKCAFKHHMENIVVNLGRLEKPAIRVRLARSTYLYNICSETKCTQNESCIYPSYEGHLLRDNKIYLDFSLDRNCDTAETFNRTLIKLICNPISKNDNYNVEGISGCTLFMQLTTDVACSKQKLNVPLLEKTEDYENVKYTVNQVSWRENCSIISNSYTDYSFDINTLKINISNVSCPRIIFNYPKNFVNVTYSTNRLCSGGTSAVYEYEIIMKCDKGNNIWRSPEFEETVCRRKYTLEGLEACKLLETSIIHSSSFGGGWKAGIAISAIAAILLLGLIGFIKFRHFRRRSSYGSVYIKRADL